MSSTPAAFSDFMKWSDSLVDRFAPDPNAPTDEERYVWGPHDEIAVEVLELFEVSTALVNYQGPSQEALEERCGRLHLQTLRTHLEGIDPGHLQHLNRQMTQSVARQRNAGVCDPDELAPQLAALSDYTSSLRDAAIAIANRVNDRAHQDYLSAFEKAARSVPGASVRITETVMGPDGQDHVLRDDMVVGPDPTNPGTPPLSFTLDDDIKTATGLNDSRTAASMNAVVQRRLESLGERLALTGHPAHDEPATQKHLRNAIEREVAVAKVLPLLPNPLAGLLPGHIHVLRMNMLLGALEAFGDGADRGRRGDRTALAAAWQSAAVGEAVRTAIPYYLTHEQRAQFIAPTGSPKPPTLPPGDHFVFHDAPLPGPAEMQVLAWLFSVDDQGNLDDSALLYRWIAGGAFETSQLSLRTGACADLARPVIDALAHGRWTTVKRRKLPGRPGSRAWRAALGRASAAEMSTGSLAQVRTLDRDPAG